MEERTLLVLTFKQEKNNSIMFFLSVIIPTYNSENTIEKCLDSLLAQTFKDFEICIIDGGSLDNTLTIATCYRTQFKNIRIVSEPDEGVYDAMNRGIDFASGKWLYFLGSDDKVFDPFVFRYFGFYHLSKV